MIRNAYSSMRSSCSGSKNSVPSALVPQADSEAKASRTSASTSTLVAEMTACTLASRPAIMVRSPLG